MSLGSKRLSELISNIVNGCITSLRDLTVEALLDIERQGVEQVEDFSALRQNRDEVLDAFTRQLQAYFDDLTGSRVVDEEAIFTFETLSLAQEDELEVMVALEGMVNNARNEALPEFISFNTRLNSLVENKQVDESNNPLDPDQVGAAFQEAIRPLEMEAHNVLALYRVFNAHVLRQLGHILSQANKTLIENGVMVNLAVDSSASKTTESARSEPRDAQPRANKLAGFDSQQSSQRLEAQAPELFSFMQNLMHPDGNAASSTTLAASQEAIDMLDSVKPDAPSPNVAESLAGVLIAGQEQGLIDRQSADVINLVTMLYQAIWGDDSVPLPIRRLIGHTQISIIKVALADTSFFDSDTHPARRLLNDIASAGVMWTEVESLAEDELYLKIKDIVLRVQDDFDGNIEFFESLVQEFDRFKNQGSGSPEALENSLPEAQERKERIAAIHDLVDKKIAERIMGRQVDAFVQQLLDEHFHKFLVMLVLKEGPGGGAWKQAINTVDVLLWSVQPHEDDGDRERLETINPRLFNNLKKALRIAQVDADKTDELLAELKTVQQRSQESTGDTRSVPGSTVAAQQTSESTPVAQSDASDLTAELDEVDMMTAGMWVEFTGEDGQDMRCKLAARITAIDKFIFVNRQGVKVLEKTRTGLARELKDGTVKIISDGLLFSRALESVIGNLRENVTTRHSGDAYQPDAPGNTSDKDSQD